MRHSPCQGQGQGARGADAQGEHDERARAGLGPADHALRPLTRSQPVRAMCRLSPKVFLHSKAGLACVTNRLLFFYSVERLYYQLFTYGYSTLDPIVVRKDGIITICSERPLPQILCSLFHGHA